jgi:hypothetical protein
MSRIDGFPLAIKVKKGSDTSIIGYLSVVRKGKARYYIMNDNGIHRYFWQAEPIEEIKVEDIQWEFY